MFKKIKLKLVENEIDTNTYNNVVKNKSINHYEFNINYCSDCIFYNYKAKRCDHLELPINYMEQACNNFTEY